MRVRTPTSARPASSRAVLARLLGALIGGALLLMTAAPVAFAHAQLLRATPADGAVLATPPEQIELEFSESVRLVDDAVRLFLTDSPTTTPVTLDAVVRDGLVTAPLPGGLPDGVYVLDYRVVSADGHPVSGAIGFRVGTGDPPTPASGSAGTPAATQALVVALTGVQYLGLLTFAGLLLFHALVLRPARPAPAVLLRWAAGAAALASVLLIPVGALRVTGAQPWAVLQPGAWLGTVQWPPAFAALAVLVLGGTALWLARRDDRAARWAVWVGTLALAAPLLVGHTQTVQPGWLRVAADLGHLLAAACWFGGLLGLGLELARVRRGPRPHDETVLGDLARTVSRFSGLALGSVGLLAASGLVMATLTLGSPDGLLGTDYGRTLLLKLGIVLPVVAIAGWNRFVLLPGIVREPSGHGRWEVLARTLRNEAALLVAVVAVTGMLTNASPTPLGPAGGDSRQASIPFEVTSQGLDVSGTLAPGRAGANRLRFSLGYDGRPATVDQVTVEFRLPAQELGPLAATAIRDPATGTYEAAVTLPTSGEWQLQVSARLSTFTKPVAVVAIAVEP